MRAPWSALLQWSSVRRRAAALDRALDAALSGLEPGADEVAAELAAARALGLRARAQRPPDEVSVVLHAALAAGEHRARPRVRRSVWRPAVAIAMLAAGLLAVTGIRPASKQPPNQAYLARNLQLVKQQIGLVESQAALGHLAEVTAKAQQLRAALLQAEQTATQFNPGIPSQRNLLVILESEIVQLNDLLARLHLSPLPLPSLPAHLPPPSRAQAGGSSPGPALSSSSTTTTTAPSAKGVTAISTLPPAPTGPLPVEANSTLAFTDAQHGWLLVPGQPSGSPTSWSASRILATTDGGHTWDQQLTEASAPLVGLDFVDATHGWAVAGEPGPFGATGGQAVYGAALLRTTDGGATWRQAAEPSSPLGQVEFVDTEHGWGVTAEDQVVQTTDGGVTWHPAGTEASAVPPLSSLCVGGGGVVWAATPGQPLDNGAPEVVRSTDGGAHWSVSFRGGTDWGAERADLRCAGGSAWAVFDLSPGAGQQLAVVERTADDGAHWSPVFQRPGQTAHQMPVSVLDHAGPFSVIDADTARFSEACPQCSSPQASVVATDDGGVTSSAAALPGSGAPTQGIAFVDAGHGLVAVMAPSDGHGPTTRVQVFATADGARTWQLVFTG